MASSGSYTTKIVRKLLASRGFISVLKNVNFSRHQAVSVIPGRWLNLQEYQSKRFIANYGIHDNVKRFVQTASAEPEEAVDQAPKADHLPESKSVFIGNLSWDTDESMLKELFETADLHPTDIKIAMRGSRSIARSRGFAFADFETHEEAQNALKLNEEDVDGRTIKVFFPKSKSIFIGNLSWDTDESILKEFFETADLHPTDVKVIMRDGRSQGFGFADFETYEEAQNALKLNEEYVDGRTVKVDLGRGGGVGGRVRRDFNETVPTNALYVGNLPYSCSVDQLYEIFTDAADIRIITDRGTGQSRGYCFVKYNNVPSAEKAKLEHNGAEVAGRTLRVHFSKQRNLPGSGGEDFEVKGEGEEYPEGKDMVEGHHQ